MLPYSLEILEYIDGRGRSPFGDWFDGLNAQAAAKITIAVTRLEARQFQTLRVLAAE